MTYQRRSTAITKAMIAAKKDTIADIMLYFSLDLLSFFLDLSAAILDNIPDVAKAIMEIPVAKIVPI